MELTDCFSVKITYRKRIGELTFFNKNNFAVLKLFCNFDV